MNNKTKVKKIISIFDELYPEAKCSLNYKDPVQLLVATQLAAQCTDARVNIVTESLFKKYKNVYDYANADITQFEQEIRSTGFYHNKAKNIINCCKMIIEQFGGQVPSNLDDLLKLPGVGRKTGNLVLGDIYGIPGLVIDTHAKRLSKRMGFTENEDPEKVEYDLMDIVPKDDWSKFCHQMVYHGRAVCKAIKPACDKCKIQTLCNFGKGMKYR